ncbi:MAG: deoxyribodipyrimidine photolyase [Gemmatimonadetes bacterium]|nr:deoxyribodipyrimidine photolyase [Gemmatimonadota bacterium]
MRCANGHAVRPGGDYVLYWMIAARRTSSSFALDRAVAWARQLAKPLVVLEALRAGYPWASDRLHRFVLDGMRDNARAFLRVPVLYHPYVEPTIGAGKGLLNALGARACVVVTDDFPCFFLPRMVASAAQQLAVRMEVVDGNGLLPLAAADRAFTAASHFRRFAQRELPRHLGRFPRSKPFAGTALPPPPQLPPEIADRWPAAPAALLAGEVAELEKLPIDHAVEPVDLRGGSRPARSALRAFVTRRLERYADAHREPESHATSRLSPYLHFGHVSAHDVFAAVMNAEGWSGDRLASRGATGARAGWWDASPSAEAFLDQLVVWRELGFNMCHRRPHDYDRYESLPDWSRATLERHGRDPRPHLYRRRDFEAADTHDELWNAAQGELLRDGWFHNTMRMLWGKKILEWSRSPREALATMTEIMNRWSLDGRNPNSYTGYLWTLGRYDRPWPERPIYGSVRSMSSRNTARKVSVGGYIATYGGAPQLDLIPPEG